MICRSIGLRHFMLVLLVLLSSTKCMSQVSNAEKFLYLQDTESIAYKQVAFSKNVIEVDKELDLRNMEFEGTPICASFHSESDSLYLGIFDNELRWYIVGDGMLFCYREENPLLKIKYVIPRLSVIKRTNWLSSVGQNYEADALYCGRDSLKISGRVSFEKEDGINILLPSLDTLKHVYVVNRKDVYWAKFVSKESCMLNVVDNADFYYAYGFDLPIFVSREKKILQQGTIVSESKEMFYFEVEPFVSSIKGNQESLGWNCIGAKDFEQDDMLSKYDVSCTDKKLNVSFMIRGDGNVKVLVANVSGMLYVSRDVETRANILQSINVNLGSYPAGRYVVYLNVMGKSYSRIINN